MKGALHKDSSHAQHQLKEAIVMFKRNIPSIELSHVIAAKIRHVSACLQVGRQGPLPTFVVT
jgi:hypothetical protein